MAEAWPLSAKEEAGEGISLGISHLTLQHPPPPTPLPCGATLRRELPWYSKRSGKVASALVTHPGR